MIETQYFIRETTTDFCRIFAKELESFYYLALLLTGEHRAEACLTGGLDRCLSFSPSPEMSARAWSRWNVVVHAASVMTLAGWQDGAAQTGVKAIGASHALVAVSALPPFERFAYVATVLEGYSAEDCAVILQRSAQEVIEARVRAMVKIASMPIDTATDVATISQQASTLAAA